MAEEYDEETTEEERVVRAGNAAPEGWIPDCKLAISMAVADYAEKHPLPDGYEVHVSVNVKILGPVDEG